MYICVYIHVCMYYMCVYTVCVYAYIVYYYHRDIYQELASTSHQIMIMD